MAQAAAVREVDAQRWSASEPGVEGPRHASAVGGGGAPQGEPKGRDRRSGARVAIRLRGYGILLDPGPPPPADRFKDVHRGARAALGRVEMH